MEYLYRADAPFTGEEWNRIDEAVVKTARQLLVGRRFLHIFGPLGSGTQSINIDSFEGDFEGDVDFFGENEASAIKTRNRKFVEIPMIYKDFIISWRDIESSRQNGIPLDISTAMAAAAVCSKKEDELIFLGDTSLGYEGLLNASGAEILQRSNWMEGENPFMDISSAIESLLAKGFTENLSLILSPDLYTQLQRIQPGTGVMEIDRIEKLLMGKLFRSSVIGKNTALLVNSDPQNMDIVIGQDLITGYLGASSLNHPMRVLETLLLRIKRKDAIVIFK